LARHFDALRTSRQYEGMLSWGKKTLPRFGVPGQMLYDGLHGFKKGVKNIIRPQGWFEDLGIKYIGPVDGHDLEQVEHALNLAKQFNGPVLVHAITEKGRGYKPAEQDIADRFHAVGQIHPETGLPVAPSRFGWTSVFADEIVKIGRKRHDVVAITAAMLEPVGLAPFQRAFPHRTFDVGIAEQHAATSAAGMAFSGLHPVVALYATFLNRAFDQVLMDVALHKAGVTFMLDRAGITGDDGASHNGMWDMALMRIVPGLQLAAPRDEDTLRQALNEAVEVSDAPTVVRYPKGAMGEPIPALETVGDLDVVGRFGVENESAQSILFVAVGAMVPTALTAAEKVAGQGFRVTVVSPVWVLPTSQSLVDEAGAYDRIVTLEDGLAKGGVGALLAEDLASVGHHVPVQTFGLPTEFLDHASRAQVVEEYGLTAEQIAHSVLER
jgi:1-deoxy-D-xylulose-5-phosphate synthase